MDTINPVKKGIHGEEESFGVELSPARQGVWFAEPPKTIDSEEGARK